MPLLRQVLYRLRNNNLLLNHFHVLGFEVVFDLWLLGSFFGIVQDLGGGQQRCLAARNNVICYHLLSSVFLSKEVALELGNLDTLLFASKVRASLIR